MLFTVHAGPNSQDGGAHGAWRSCLLYSFLSCLFLVKLASPPITETAMDISATCHHLRFTALLFIQNGFAKTCKFYAAFVNRYAACKKVLCTLYASVILVLIIYITTLFAYE